MAKSWLVFLGGTFGGTLAAAALAASYLEDSVVNDGKWNARIDGDARSARQARVEIDNFEGQWREIGPRRTGDPCRGTKPFPITVQKSSTKEVEFTVWAEQVSKCPDFALTLKVIDESTLTGTLKLIDDRTSDGFEVRLTREPVKRNTKR